MIIPRRYAKYQSSIGGKAASLQKLQSLGFKIPGFYVIPGEAIMPVTGLNGKNFIDKRAEILNHKIEESHKIEILSAIKKLGFPMNPLAVRSSVRDEDGNEHAFAGMMDSFLNINTERVLWDSILRVAASAYSDRVFQYRQIYQLDLKAQVNIIVQVQVEALSSGVMFSTFPDYPQELAIHSVWGYGEGLVAGHISPDEYYFLKFSGKLHRQTIARKESLFSNDRMSGITEEQLSEDKKEQQSLTNEQANQLFQIGISIEKAFQMPQDIEFAIDQKDIWIVQARPITQSIPEIVVYDNSNIQESYCGVTTPLTFSFARRAYATVYSQTMQALGLNSHVINNNIELVNHLLGLVKGRIYYNINNWYRGLQLLPRFSQNKADMERMMGLTEPVEFIEDQNKGLIEKLVMVPGLVYNLIRLLLSFSKLNTSIIQFRKHFIEIYDWYNAYDFSRSGISEMKRTKVRLDSEILNNWSTPIINDFYVMMTNGKMIRQLKKIGIDDPEEFQTRIFSDDHQMENTLPTKELIRLARLATKQPQIKEQIISKNENFQDVIEEKYPEFHQQVLSYISRFGDRTIGELKLETITMRISPVIFYNYLRNYLIEDDFVDFTKGSDLKREALKELQIKLSGRWFGNSVKKNIAKLENAIRNREAMRLDRTRLFGMYRDLYRKVGKYHCTEGYLAKIDDIFWLEESEIWDGDTTNWKEIVENRRNEFNEYEKLEVPGRVEEPSPPLETPSYDENSKFLYGQGCYPGSVEGECIVVRNPQDDLDIYGKIIVAERTDPGWASLFPISRGVIIERGSSLSHSVILLRELGIPSIINVQGLTKRIKSGQHIFLDAQKGAITIL